MRCTRARRLLHLNREGELPESLRNRVMRHAACCPQCAAELERIGKTEGALESLRNAEPVLTDPAGLTMAVMREVETAHRVSSDRWFERMLVAATSVKVRERLQFAAALVVIAFFTQSAVDAHRMSLLDERLALVPAGATPPLQSITTTAGTAAMKEMLGGMHPDEAGIAEIARALRIGPVGTTPLMDRLGAKYAGLFSISAEDGLDDRERAILATEGRAFLKEVEQMVTMAEAAHAH